MLQICLCALMFDHSASDSELTLNSEYLPATVRNRLNNSAQVKLKNYKQLISTDSKVNCHFNLSYILSFWRSCFCHTMYLRNKLSLLCSKKGNFCSAVKEADAISTWFLSVSCTHRACNCVKCENSVCLLYNKKNVQKLC